VDSLLLANGIEINTIASVIGKSVKTIENWHRQYLTKGIESLDFFQYKPKKTFLDDNQVTEVIKWVKTENPSKIKQVREYIKEHFKVKYSTEAVRKLLHKNGLTTGSVK
jgi:transposase